MKWNYIYSMGNPLNPLLPSGKGVYMKIDLRDPDTWAALERQAYDGTVNLLPLPPPAYKYFSELTAVYRAFRFEGMSREDSVTAASPVPAWI